MTVITVGDETTFEGNIASVSVAALSSTKAIAAYRDVGDSNKGKACILDISGTTVTAGTPAEFEAGVTYNVDICALSATKALVVYRDSGDSSKGKACVLDVSGSTITPGTPTQYTTSGWENSVDALDSSKAIATWREATDSSKGNSVVLSVSGTTITPGAVTTFRNGVDEAHVTSVAALSATKAVVLYLSDVTVGDDAIAQVLSVSGTTITAGAEETIASDAAQQITGTGICQKKITKVDSGAAVCVYPTSNATFSIAYLAVSGTTVTAGTPLSVTTAASPRVALATASRVWAVSTTDNLETLNISGTDMVADDNRDSTINNDGVTSLAQLESGKVIIIYVNGSSEGAARVATIPVNARFYHGFGTLEEKFTLPFGGVAPGGMTLKEVLGTVVFGSDEPAADPVVYSDYPYPTGTVSDTGYSETAYTNRIRWI